MPCSMIRKYCPVTSLPADHFLQDTRHRDRITGINTVQYTVTSSRQLTIDDTHVKLINVELECDYKDTPWCVTPDQLQQLIDSGVVEETIYGDLAAKMDLTEKELKKVIQRNKKRHRWCCCLTFMDDCDAWLMMRKGFWCMILKHLLQMHSLKA